MKKLAKIILNNISYQGDNVGDDLKFEIRANNQSTVFEKQLIYKTITTLDKNIFNDFMEGDTKVSLGIKVTEQDEVFDDVGELKNEVVDINFASPNPTKHYEVKVQERRLIKKKVAVFNFEFEVRAVEQKRFIEEEKGGDGWLEVRIEGIHEVQSLPAFLSIKYEKTENGRDHFTILEGIHKNKKASVALKKDGSSHLEEDYLDYKKPVRAFYSISKKIFTISNKHYQATDDPKAPWQKGIYKIEIPDHPHKFRSYDDSRLYKVWFRINHPDGERYLHTGIASRGCLTITEVKKWNEICELLMTSRVGDGVSVGTVDVVD